MSKQAQEINKEQAENVKIDQTQKLLQGIMAAGLSLAKVFQQAGNTQRSATLKHADALKAASEEDVNTFLKAFREGLGDTSSAAATSSKVKAIILAYRIPKFEQAVGLNEAKEPIMVTKSGAEWLHEAKGTFEEFVSLARKIRGATEGQGSGGGRVKKKLTDKDMERVEENLKLASKDQAEEIVARGLDQIKVSNPKGWEPEMLAQIQACVKRLATSDTFFWKKLAQEFQDNLDDYYAQRDAVAASMTQKSDDKGPAVPAAAEEQQKAA